jgi:hypothetical protein
VLRIEPRTGYRRGVFFFRATNRRSQSGVRHEGEKRAVRVAAFGFAGKGTQNLFDLLQVAKLRTVPDIRLN